MSDIAYHNAVNLLIGYAGNSGSIGAEHPSQVSKVDQQMAAAAHAIRKTGLNPSNAADCRAMTLTAAYILGSLAVAHEIYRDDRSLAERAFIPDLAFLILHVCQMNGVAE